MFVATRMTENPVTVTPDTSVTEAKNMMQKNKFRRLPIVQDGKLLGIVTDRDLREVSPSPATTLAKHEANYLLDKILLRDIMKKKVLTICADATIEEAALMMYKEKIGGLVVVDVNGAVVGIITETDIFKCFVDVMGLAEGKTRITLGGADRIGMLHEITGVFKELDISIDSMVALPGPDHQAQQIIRADVPDVELLTKKLGDKGYPVLHVAKIG
ncbi:acetoin utilization protein AcuB [Sporomusaceae bacterium BoRhaA]|uniref:CBS and ACT domain-containing protein n=1 Tax=Pelorhabdus rhamnosifermentans TaxID=2772457 RepID=UPI001C06488F|nr:CBS and ACT domain-containing protein [Pelorhabdus rhamnosifermentans]MBU2704205.1 acetoin utilization protein AcuB [Pelorhabdus rhamnosifermentans]